jgi:phosphoribosylanthranilate isomerase
MPPVTPRIKICCMASRAEAELAIAQGADAIGLVSAMPSGPGPIPETLITEIAAAVRDRVRAFLLTSEPDATAIIGQVRRTGVTTVQIVDRVMLGTHRDLRQALPGIEIVQVIHVVDERSVREAFEVAEDVDALLLDSGRPDLPVKELGGTGRVHDWALSRRIREQAGVPVWLAGGLNAANAGEALRAVEPYGLDVCSGVRTEGRLDEAKLAAFVRAARSGEPAARP